ncbi:MAG: hypothetical protein QNJ72_02880 [Pleurocapsa sp. MO_226.B13]|nr:hypothetical protein [Pleurocapsa sp. MO_226.B13]
MKAIVANVLFGSILSCLGWMSSAYANSQVVEQPSPEATTSPISSAKLSSTEKLPIAPHLINVNDRIFPLNKLNTSSFSIDSEAEIIFRDRYSLNLSQNQGLALNKQPYTHQNRQADLTLGFHKTFWPSEHQGKYWGLTTIEHWGNNDRPKHKLNLTKSNYTNSAPTLPSGNSALTVSGGGDKNLIEKTPTSREFEEFRGGVTYHRGLMNDVTMGVGFVYEDYLVGFTQFTYQSDRFRLRTTVTLLTRESGLDFRSHVRYEPAENLILNYYYNRDKNHFDANWKLFPGLTLTVDGKSEKDSFSTGIKFAVRNEYLSITAQAVLDSDRNLEWKLDSQIGRFKFVHSSKKQKNISELNLGLWSSDTFGFQCSAFIKYEARQGKQDRQEFMEWGSKLQSDQKITPNQHLWTVNLGFGSGHHGNGLIASGSYALKPNLSFKLTYQEISPSSDDNEIKLELSSK